MLRQVVAAVKSREQEVIHRQAIPDNVREERLVPMEVPQVRPVTLWPLYSTWIPQPGAQNPQKKLSLAPMTAPHTHTFQQKKGLTLSHSCPQNLLMLFQGGLY